MSINALERRVEAAVTEEQRTRRLANYLADYFKLDRTVVQRVIRFIVRYVSMSPQLLVQTTVAARKEGILKEFLPILTEASSYWARERNITPAPGRLVSLADEAYLTNAFVQLVGMTYEGRTGRQLLAHDMHHSNLAMRQLLGPNNAELLDGLVDQKMRNRPVRAAIRDLQHWGGTLDVGIKTDFLENAQALLPFEGTGNVVVRLDDPAVVPQPLPMQQVEGGISYRVWYGTNRKPVDSGDRSKGFTNQRDPNNKVSYGICHVFVPRSHKPGSLGTHWIKRWLTLRLKDDHLKLVSHKELANAQTFFESLSGQIAAQPKDLRHLLVYIHGFDVSFEGAALRAGQIGADLQVPGETVFFSWPSYANPDRYVPDGNRLEKSESPLRDFLIATVKQTAAEAVHVVAHSMGNRGLIRVARALQGAGVKFANIILAAPDVDQDFFREHATVYPMIANRTTLYASRLDLALKIASAKFLGDGPRAGLTPPVTIVPSIDTVQVTQFNLFDFGHGYWAQARDVIVDIYQLMRYGAAPPRLFLKAQLDTGNGPYWVLQ